MTCPVCDTQGLISKFVLDPGGFNTVEASQVFYDEDDHLHVHNPNRPIVWWHCTQNHTGIIQYGNDCPSKAIGVCHYGEPMEVIADAPPVRAAWLGLLGAELRQSWGGEKAVKLKAKRELTHLGKKLRAGEIFETNEQDGQDLIKQGFADKAEERSHAAPTPAAGSGGQQGTPSSSGSGSGAATAAAEPDEPKV